MQMEFFNFAYSVLDLSLNIFFSISDSVMQKSQKTSFYKNTIVSLGLVMK